MRHASFEPLEESLMVADTAQQLERAFSENTFVQLPQDTTLPEISVTNLETLYSVADTLSSVLTGNLSYPNAHLYPYYGANVLDSESTDFMVAWGPLTRETSLNSSITTSGFSRFETIIARARKQPLYQQMTDSFGVIGRISTDTYGGPQVSIVYKVDEEFVKQSFAYSPQSIESQRDLKEAVLSTTPMRFHSYVQYNAWDKTVRTRFNEDDESQAAFCKL